MSQWFGKSTSHRAESTTYDTPHRLTGSERGDLNGNKDAIIAPATREQSWTLDKLGNWTGTEADDTPQLRRLHNIANEIEALGVEKDVYLRVEHDDAGNLRILPDRADPDNDATKYVYDYRNRLIEVWETEAYDENDPENTNWGNDPVARYYYDGLNRKVKKHLTSGTDVIYLYDGWQCIEEREDDGGTWEARRQYVYGGRYIDEPLIFDKDYDSDGICTDFNYGGSRGAHRYYYAQQVNYNVTAMVVDDGDGSVTLIEWAEYDPYGAATVTIADGQSATGNPYLFQGRRWEEETGLYYFRNRWYSAELGRLVQRDPAGYVDGMGLYLFAGGVPVTALDPHGHDSIFSVLRSGLGGHPIDVQLSVTLPWLRWDIGQRWAIDITFKGTLKECCFSDLGDTGLLAEGTVAARLTGGIGYKVPDFPGGGFSLTANASLTGALPECENKLGSASVTIGARGVLSAGYGAEIDVSYTVGIFQSVNEFKINAAFGWMGTVQATVDVYVEGTISGSIVLKRYRK